MVRNIMSSAKFALPRPGLDKGADFLATCAKMGQNAFDLRALESLSTEELVALADSRGLDVPPGLDRAFVLGELLDLDSPRERSGPAGATDLPERYGESFVDALARDPLWAFVFWEARGDAGEGRFLRVSSIDQKDQKPDDPGEGAPFSVEVSGEDGSIYIGIPPEMGRRIKVSLCLRRGAGASVVAESAPVDMPGVFGGHEGSGNPLAELSGAAAFPAVRSVDRSFSRFRR